MPQYRHSFLILYAHHVTVFLGSECLILPNSVVKILISEVTCTGGTFNMIRSGGGGLTHAWLVLFVDHSYVAPLTVSHVPEE